MKKFKFHFVNVILILFIFFIVINFIPPKKVMKDNPFVTEGIMIAAHRGGADLNPDNTLKAFDAAVIEYHSDILELDLHMTKDGELVVIHDSYINDFCDVEEVKGVSEKQHVIDYTYEELLQFNFGHDFEALDGSTPYKDYFSSLSGTERINAIKNEGLGIVRIDDLFSRYSTSHPDLMYIVEIKNGGDLGYQAADKLNKLITEDYKDINLIEKIVIGTFHGEIETYLKNKYPNIMRGASTKGAAQFIITELFKVNLFDNSSFACLQIPQSFDLGFMELDLNRTDIITRCQLRNIAVQYWTLNTREEMEIAIELGADCIMTDNPKLLYEILKEKNLR